MTSFSQDCTEGEVEGCKEIDGVIDGVLDGVLDGVIDGGPISI